LPRFPRWRALGDGSCKIDVLVCVPSTLIAQAALAADGVIEIGGEDCRANDAGPFTGDIDAAMLRDAGATNVILGHSERHGHNETDALVAATAEAAWRHGLATIV
jgi:triosephosphate isomerase